MRLDYYALMPWLSMLDLIALIAVLFSLWTPVTIVAGVWMVGSATYALIHWRQTGLKVRMQAQVV
jgi:ABC-type uncharacterized transport system permease subunit